MASSTAFLSVWAQDNPPNSGSPERDDEAVCMARVLRDVPQNQNARKGSSFKIVAIRGAVPSLASKGFFEVTCEAAELDTLERRTKYQWTVCEMAASGNVAVQNQYERALGERPAALCANAQLVTGVQHQKAQGAGG
jgi:hypothetical protein